jgi:UDP-GlcNAc:undecaprenyl-phosphate GlcNAc-1-phosphate transferase
MGRKLGIVDRPAGRRAHARETPRLGGVALFAACAVTIAVLAWRGLLTAGYSPDDCTRLKGLLLGGTAAFIFGLIDDRFDLPAAPQFAFQFLLALIALASLLWLERFTLPVIGFVALSDYVWGPLVYIPLTIIWVMGMVNTVNWLDGLDGLAAGVGAILCLVLASTCTAGDSTAWRCCLWHCWVHSWASCPTISLRHACFWEAVGPFSWGMCLGAWD